MGDRFNGIYIHFFETLKGVSSIISIVPEENIRPSFDAESIPEGNLIDYGFTESSWDRKRRRGEATLNVRVRTVDNKAIANRVLDLIRDSCTERVLTAASDKVKFALFKEVETAGTDEGVDETNRFVASTGFKVRFIEQ